LALRRTIYDRLPVFLQNRSIQWLDRRVVKNRLGGDFPKLLTEFSSREHLSSDEVHAVRREKLRTFLTAASDFPLHNHNLNSIGASPELDDPDEILAALPVLTKQDLIDHHDAVQNSNQLENVFSAHTSGTTGAGLHFNSTRQNQWAQWAVWWRYRHRFGLAIDTPCEVFTGEVLVPTKQRTAPFWRYGWKSIECFYSGYHISPNTARSYVENIKKRKSPWIHGYPSAIAALAQEIISQNIDPGNSTQHVTLAGENVLEHQIDIIQTAFDAPVHQHYGQTESVATISECKTGALHVDEDFTTVEFLPEQHSPQQVKIIGTATNNNAFGFLRYDTDDWATIAKQQCACGLPGRTIESIDGRKEDYVVLTDGTRLGRLDHVFKDMINIKEAQIRQDSYGRLDVLVVKGNNYSEIDENKLQHEFDIRTNSMIDIEFHYLPVIEKTASGKLRFVISTMEDRSGSIDLRP
jgi:phenylacetate-CoA ligase